MEAFTNFFDSFPAWLVAITAVVTAAAGITALTPTPKDDAVLGKVRKVLDWLALNIGNARNEKPKT